LMREMLPDGELVALKLPTVLAPFRVVPPIETVVNVPVVLTRPTPVSLKMPVELRLTLPPKFAETVPVKVRAPVFETMMLPPPLSVMVVKISGLDVLIREMLPEVVLTAVNVPTALAPFNTVPLADRVSSVPVVLIRPGPDSRMFAVDLRVTLPPPVADTVPLMTMPPVLSTVI